MPSIWRRRTCPQCGFTFTTSEVLPLDELLVIHKNNGAKAAYSRGLLLASIIDSLRPTGADISQAYWLVITVEEKIIAAQKQRNAWQPVSTELLARLTYETLLAFNTVAGITYGAAHGLMAAPTQKRKRGRPYQL
ncbi:hypothetical protein CYG49_03700 [Candidatus Saccharibacteria bacterium]|nr:MAG: hypothetical protein CYG49_03700 [Candidatus Saccharibacteria bacterium]